MPAEASEITLSALQGWSLIMLGLNYNRFHHQNIGL